MLDDARRAALEADLRDRPDSFGLIGHLWDGPLLREHLRRRYGVKLGVRQCQRLFHGMGFRRRKPRPQVAGAADPERSEAFEKTASPGARDDIDLWSEDECHFQRHGSRCGMWVPPEDKDPVLRHAPTRQSSTVFVRPAYGRPSLAMNRSRMPWKPPLDMITTWHGWRRGRAKRLTMRSTSSATLAGTTLC